MKPMKTTDGLDPILFVIFGGAGDLTWRKLIPALFDLSQDRSQPAQFAIIAVDRIKLGDDALRRRLHDGVNQFSRFGKTKTAAWNQFANPSRRIKRPSTPSTASPSARGPVISSTFRRWGSRSGSTCSSTLSAFLRTPSLKASCARSIRPI